MTSTTADKLDRPLLPYANHVRGLAVLALGIACGLVVFAWIALRGAPPAGSAQAAVPFGIRESLVLRSDNRGQVLFGRYCDSCHPAGQEGIGASLRSPQFKRTITTSEQIAGVVRKGGFDMPPFPPDLINDDDLNQIAAYVLSLPAS